MTSTNKKAPGAIGIRQPFKQPMGHAPQIKPVVAQLKRAVSTPGVKRPIAPPAYRPQPIPKVLQKKSALDPKPKGDQATRKPAAPLVYRPQTVPKVLQTKRSPGQSTQHSQAPRPPVALPVYRPEQKRIAQTKIVSAAQERALPKVAPVCSKRATPIGAHARMARSLQTFAKKGVRPYQVIWFGDMDPKAFGKGKNIDIKTVSHAGVYFPDTKLFFEWGHETKQVTKNEKLSTPNRDIWSYEGRSWYGTTVDAGTTGMTYEEIREFSNDWDENHRDKIKEGRTKYPNNCRGFADQLVAQLHRKSHKPPPGYHPQAIARAAQLKMANGAVNRKQPVASPVYRPEAKKIVQPQAVSHPRMSPQSRLVQLAEDSRLHLETTMTSQFKLSFPFLFVDLNCGWYCEMAAIDFWRKKLNLQLPEDILPKSTTFAFHPGKEGRRFVTSHPTPASVQAWKTLIKDEGPIMASGKLGPTAGALRIGHFVLIVGADVTKDVLILRDPLSASETFEGKFEVIKGDFNAWVYSINVGELMKADTRI